MDRQVPLVPAKRSLTKGQFKTTDYRDEYSSAPLTGESHIYEDLRHALAGTTPFQRVCFQLNLDHTDADSKRDTAVYRLVSSFKLPFIAKVKRKFCGLGSDVVRLQKDDVLLFHFIGRIRRVLTIDDSGRKVMLPIQAKQVYDILPSVQQYDDKVFQGTKAVIEARPLPNRLRIVEAHCSMFPEESQEVGDVLEISHIERRGVLPPKTGVNYRRIRTPSDKRVYLLKEYIDDIVVIATYFNSQQVLAIPVTCQIDVEKETNLTTETLLHGLLPAINTDDATDQDRPLPNIPPGKDMKELLDKKEKEIQTLLQENKKNYEKLKEELVHLKDEYSQQNFSQDGEYSKGTNEQDIKQENEETDKTVVGGSAIEEKLSRQVKLLSASVEEVGSFLKDLRLDSYVPRFQEELVDGELLVRLDEDILKEDIGMKKIQARRLMLEVKKRLRNDEESDRVFEAVEHQDGTREVRGSIEKGPSIQENEGPGSRASTKEL
ncbi:Sterile alpha and TIR motif-containing protein 1 [Holothuria leucospilota]|uniref:Sterile alpha and TIR motif-containing protein 1 n=1 Tax=Holothuria leucospilota TaxID=206669 RepID=A0A9Q1CNG2_HOLLE|nr:Sterile alpha and TIR motif-containing protein 1 [Holothuria leucospilota]